MYQTIEETEPQDELFQYNYASFGYLLFLTILTKIHKEVTIIGTKETH